MIYLSSYIYIDLESRFRLDLIVKRLLCNLVTIEATKSQSADAEFGTGFLEKESLSNQTLDLKLS